MHPLISAKQLRKHLSQNRNTIVFDCRFSLADAQAGYNQYQHSHIDSAHYLHLEKDLSAPPQKHGGRHPLPHLSAFENTLRRCGVNQDSHLVVYDDSRNAFAARAWWLCKYFGVKNVQILDGGWRAWHTQFAEPKLAATATVRGNVTLSGGHMRLIEHPQLCQQKPQKTLVDSRESKRYLGAEEPIDPIAGHIPGAVNKPWQDVTDASGHFLSAALQRQRWAEISAGDDKLVIYCGSGVTACVNLVSLALIERTATLYVGSWSDWCSHTDSENFSQRVATKSEQQSLRQ